ncbi:MAG: DUF748 domain-containing protein [Burkholderiaceae bacterium]|nr:DUF748 domain-containing protein [Burkholderiaceae bacterium]
MSTPTRRRLPLWLGAAAMILSAALAIAMWIATSTVERIALEWLDEEGRAAEIDVGWRSVVLRDVSIRAPADWPDDEAFHADTVTFYPNWTALLSDRVEISAIEVRGYRLTVLRHRAGDIDVLPSLRANARKRASQNSDPKRESHVGKLIFADGRVDFYDAQISRPAHHIPLNDVRAEIGPVDFPGLNTTTQIDISGEFGKPESGRLHVSGSLVAGTRDADIDTALTGVAVQHLSPYLQRGTKSTFRRGSIDLSLDSTVRDRKINASGQLTLSRLELSDDGLASLPRQAAIAALEDDKGQATFKFTLTGPLAKPVFNMEEGVSARIAGGVAGALGISIEGLANGIGGTIENIGGALSNMFGEPR